MYNQQLYQEYRLSRSRKHTSTDKSTSEYLHQSVFELPDQQIVSLESSIPLMRGLGVVQEIRNVEDIVRLMQNKRGEQTSWQGGQRELWECRLIYFMWHIIAQEQINMKQFKRLIGLLGSSQQNRAEIIESIYGQKEEIAEMVHTWDKLLKSEGSSPSALINDISIIKTKNEGCFGSNKENVSAENNRQAPNIRNSFDPKSSRPTNSRVRLQKSYTKKSTKSTKAILDRNLSTGRNSSKRSESYSLSNYAPTHINFFSQADTLTPQDQKKLVERLYDCSKYRAREQLKKQIDEQRIKVELDRCTFKPQINKNKKIVGQKQPTKVIKGFEKAIDRMKLGYQKKKQIENNLEYRSSKQTTSPIQPSQYALPTQCMAPKFHQKQPKQAKAELFQLKFSLGRMTIPIKVRQSDSLEQLVERIARIYSLKPHQKEYIHQGIISSLQQYRQAVLQAEQQML